MNERIPQKLIIELASLPIHKFKVEAKSKCQSIILPIAPTKQSHQIKSNKINGQSVKQENGCDDSELDTVNENNLETMNLGENRLPKPLENSYVSLKCTIINKNLALVPPIKICIPYNYPDSNPLVDCIQLEDFDDDMLPGYSNFYPSLFFIIYLRIFKINNVYMYFYLKDTLGILRRINKQFQLNYLHLSERFSVTQVLDAWVSVTSVNLLNV
jgi:hypothetical protein